MTEASSCACVPQFLMLTDSKDAHKQLSPKSVQHESKFLNRYFSIAVEILKNKNIVF